jgi:hypothetical protein
MIAAWKNLIREMSDWIGQCVVYFFWQRKIWSSRKPSLCTQIVAGGWNPARPLSVPNVGEAGADTDHLVGNGL